MTTAIAAFCRWFKGTDEYALMQDFFVDKTVDGHVFQSFNTSQIDISRTADTSGLTLEFPATKTILQLGNSAIENEYLVSITLYEMPADTGVPTDLSSAVVVASFIGEVQEMQTDLNTISIEIGSALDAISGDIPGRKITTSLVGRLPTL